MSNGTYPHTRLRRNRRTTWLRDLVREHRLTPDRLILPVFVREDDTNQYPKTLAPSMTGLERHNLDALEQIAQRAESLGIRAMLLFPVIAQHQRDAEGSTAFDPENLVCRAVRRLKKNMPQMGIIVDVALDPYTSHGHDGLLQDGDVANDPTNQALARQALTLAQAGCDIVAPSDMMDGRVGVLRALLDDKGFSHVGICPYAAKYASSLYQPFRQALRTQALLEGDKSSYQMDPGNGDEALREIALDIHEGADMIIVKPGLPYLDIIHRASKAFPVPVFGYHVSGEYAMLRTLADQGGINYDAALIESLLAFLRAGARGIITYGALDAARLLTAQNPASRPVSRPAPASHQGPASNQGNAKKS